ncbi:MAG: hypothetical protein ABIH42_00690 [Planctomycetota bacterium]
MKTIIIALIASLILLASCSSAPEKRLIPKAELEQQSLEVEGF